MRQCDGDCHPPCLPADHQWRQEQRHQENGDRLRRIGVARHVAQNTNRHGGSAIDGRTTRHTGNDNAINPAVASRRSLVG
ncbi:protein of unknown function [Cyanobium sp. NIES-981]|nr:protein of unknown function [Cyanobium sp. NIES-981]